MENKCPRCGGVIQMTNIVQLKQKISYPNPLTQHIDVIGTNYFCMNCDYERDVSFNNKKTPKYKISKSYKKKENHY